MRRPFKKWRLILITAFLTLAGAILYANFKPPEKNLVYRIEDETTIDSPHFERVLSEVLGPPVVDGNTIVSLYNGDQIFPAMLKAIRDAKKTITFESYIYWSGKIGDEFAGALAERAKAGVKVHVLIDWLGSQKIDTRFVDRMVDAGAQVEWYRMLHWYNVTRTNNRTHRKLLIIDGTIGFTGGVGIADEWSGDGLQADKWRDSHFEIHGPVVAQMQATFMDNWLKIRPEVHQTEDYFPVIPANGPARAQMFRSSSRQGSSSVRIMYLMAIAAARKSIYLESSYFVPDRGTIDALVEARRRGVDVKIIVPGPKTDVAIVRHASRELWQPLLEAGVKIYEYAPAMYHCKVFVVDGYFSSIGSTNFDERSFRLNDEANLNVLDRDFAARETSTFELDRSRSREITLDEWNRRPLASRVLEKVSILVRSQL